MKMTVKLSKKLVPFMLMFAPSGRTNCATASLIPCEAAQRSVTGSVAMLESVPNTVTRAVAKALQGHVSLDQAENLHRLLGQLWRLLHYMCMCKHQVKGSSCITCASTCT